MANHKSAEKAHRQALKRKAANSAVKSKARTFSNKVLEAVASGDLTLASQALSFADSQISRAVSSGVFKLNTAARKVSKLAHKVKALEKSLSTQAQ